MGKLLHPMRTHCQLQVPRLSVPSWAMSSAQTHQKITTPIMLALFGGWYKAVDIIWLRDGLSLPSTTKLLLPKRRKKSRHWSMLCTVMTTTLPSSCQTLPLRFSVSTLLQRRWYGAIETTAPKCFLSQHMTCVNLPSCICSKCQNMTWVRSLQRSFPGLWQDWSER